MGEALISLVIITIVIGTLLSAARYTKTMGTIAYHDRYVLLRLDGYMQRIKYYNMNALEMGDFGNLQNRTFYIEEELDHTIDGKIRVNVSFDVIRRPDLNIDRDTHYYEVKATARWRENWPYLYGNVMRQKERVITLREDYYIQIMEGQSGEATTTQ
jgi:hypothetical protein